MKSLAERRRHGRDRWPERRLSELVEPDRPIRYGVVQPGGAPKQGGVFLVRGGDVVDGRIAAELRRIHKEVAEEYASTSLRGGEILIALVGYPGECAIAPSSLAGASIARQVARIAIRDTLTRDWVSLFLRSPSGRRRLLRPLVGSAQQVINIGSLESVCVPLPPHEVQAAAVRLEQALDRTCAELARALRAKTRLKQALLEQLLTGKLRFPQFDGTRAERAPLASIAAPVAARVEPKSVAPSTPCVELEHIAQGEGRLVGSTTASSVASLKTSFRRGDVLFGKLRPYLRKFAGPSFDGLCSTEIWALRPREGVCRSDYLLQLVQSESVLRAACASTGTKMPRAEWDVVGAALVWLPEPTEQERIARLMGLLDTELNLLDRQLAAVRKLKRGLMQKLLTGELEVPAADQSQAQGEQHAWTAK